MCIVLKKKSNHVVPSASTIQRRAAMIRRDWSAREHSERYRLAAWCQWRLALEVCTAS
jgi:hypothetical protein